MTASHTSGTPAASSATKSAGRVNLGGSYTFPHTSLTVNRLGYGAMKLTGPQIWGPPADTDAAIGLLREAAAAGVNHIDTSDFYGPHVTNQLIKRALYPYPAGLVIVSKLGARRAPDKSWIPALSRQELTDGLHDNLRNLGLERMDIVNLRVGPPLGPQEGSIEEPLTALAELQQQGKIRHIGLSNITPKQFADGSKIAKIVCVQNLYNVAWRQDDAFIDHLGKQGVAYVPFFPLGGFSPLQTSELDAAAAAVNSTPMQVALAWLLHRAPNMLLIPGTSSAAHLRENLKAPTLKLSAKVLADLDEIHKSAAPPAMPAH
jgi:pyridoxine 4-dehydrogenase